MTRRVIRDVAADYAAGYAAGVRDARSGVVAAAPRSYMAEEDLTLALSVGGLQDPSEAYADGYAQGWIDVIEPLPRH